MPRHTRRSADFCDLKITIGDLLIDSADTYIEFISDLKGEHETVW